MLLSSSIRHVPYRPLQALSLARSFACTCSAHANQQTFKPVDHTAVHRMLDMDQGVAGVHGGDHAIYHALAEAKTGRQLDRLKGGRFAPSDEWKVPDLTAHIAKPEVQAHWSKITTLDPWGMESGRPTISATPASMEVPEIVPKMRRDGKIVTEDGFINCIKIAMDPVWYIPGVADRLGVHQDVLREKLASWTQNETVLDKANDIFLPSIGGTTIYVIGDLSAITDPKRKVAVRTHDECNGSDVFGTDICTCRPYLVYAIEGCVETAQAGGVGIIAYYRKEGRALGEVTKFRVYNARKYQSGGDRPETYFKQTENIAGIVDARAQELMPDPLLWLGINRIDRLLSMSKDKYEAITGAGIEVLNRDSLPEDMVPKNAYVEISAKISSGYAAFAPKAHDSNQELWKLESVRTKSRQLFELGLQGKLPHFDVDMTKLDDVVNRVISATAKRYPGSPANIPLHSRLRHFEAGHVDRLADMELSWRQNKIPGLEQCRRIIDLTIPSVLVDAGAGAKWAYQDKTYAGGKYFTRSEGLGIASLEMFRRGELSADGKQQIADAAGLQRITDDDILRAFQVSSENPLVGVDGRRRMLNRLGAAIEAHPDIFATPGGGPARPGNILDYLLFQVTDSHRKLASVRLLWQAVVDGLGDVFPDPSGTHLGDTWTHSSLGAVGSTEAYVPFHKLGQWLTYSLLEVLQGFGIKFVDLWLLTGLAEYRNGGLFVDSGVLVPKNPKEAFTKSYQTGDELVVEWRALTVSLLDEVEKRVQERLGVSQRELPLAKILEGGTWYAGRELAFQKRPQTGDPPIKIASTGDVF